MNESGSPLSDDIDARDAVRAMKVAEQMELERARREAKRRLDAEERGAVADPEIVTLEQLLAQPDPVVRYRVDRLLPTDARALLAAQFKAGKTTFRDNLLRSLVDGDLFLGSFEVHPVVGRVAVIDPEMAKRQVRLWLRDQRIRNTDRVVLVFLRGRAATFDPLSADSRAWWADWFKQHDVRYLILDGLRPVLDALALNEHTDAGRFLVGLDALLEAADIPEALVIHHMGHMGERSRGDSRIVDWADVNLKLTRQDDDPASARYISAYGRDVDQPEARLDYDPLLRRLTIVGGSRYDARLDTVLEAIVAALEATDEPLSGRRVKDALEDTEHGKNTIDAALKAGIENGRLTAEAGPRNSRLYRVSRSVPVVSLGQSAERVSECPPPLIGEGHWDTPRRLDEVHQISVSQRDTQRGRGDDAGRF